MFCVLCVLALLGEVCVLCFVFWPLLEELYLVENVTHCVFALKARAAGANFWGKDGLNILILRSCKFFRVGLFSGFGSVTHIVIWNTS